MHFWVLEIITGTLIPHALSSRLLVPACRARRAIILAGAWLPSQKSNHTCLRLAAELEERGAAALVVPIPAMPVLQSPMGLGTGRPG